MVHAHLHRAWILKVMPNLRRQHIHLINQTAPLLLAVASGSSLACSSNPVVFAIESIVYSAFKDGGEKGEGAEEGELGPPAAATAAAVATTARARETAVSPAPSAEGEGEGEEHEVLFEEGDLGITIKVGWEKE